jgi:hypothetical protein
VSSLAFKWYSLCRYTAVTQDVGPRGPGDVQLKLADEEPDFDAEAELALREAALDQPADAASAVAVAGADEDTASQSRPGTSQGVVAQSRPGTSHAAHGEPRPGTPHAANAAKASLARNARSDTAREALALVDSGRESGTRAERDPRERVRVVKEALREEWLREASWWGCAQSIYPHFAGIVKGGR